MSKRAKLLTTMCSLVVALCAFAFGVFAATKITYDMANSVTYHIKDALVKVTRTVEYLTPTELNIPSTKATVVSDTTGKTWTNASTMTFQTYDENTGVWKDPQVSGDITYANNTIADKINANFNNGYVYKVTVKISSVASTGVKVTYTIPETTRNNAYITAGDCTLTSGQTVTTERYLTYYMGILDLTTSIGTDIAFETISLSIENADTSSSTQTGDLYINNVQTSAGELTEYAGTYTNLDQSPIDFTGITVPAKSTETITINLTSLKPEYQRVDISYNTLPTGVTVQGSSLYLPKNSTQSLSSNLSREYKVKISNISDTPVSVEDLGISISYTEKTQLLQNDTSNQYYYVEMGTFPMSTENVYVRWRYISADGTNKCTYNPSVAPTGTGYFIQETKIQTDILNNAGGGPSVANFSTRWENYIGSGGNSYFMVSYNTNYTISSPYVHTETGWENIQANDYATSTIRRYINGTTVLKHPDWEAIWGDTATEHAGSEKYGSSNMFDDFMIDITTNEVYALISGRSLEDLYKGINQNGTDVKFPTFTSNAISSTEVDKFWIPSYTEIQNMLCGGTWDNSIADWDTESSLDIYWLRSPYPYEKAYEDRQYMVAETGNLMRTYVSRDYICARSMFIIEI